MKGMFKRALAGVAAAALAVTGFALGAGAANATPADSAKITVNDPNPGSTYTAYRFATFADVQGSGDTATSVSVMTAEGWDDAVSTAALAAWNQSNGEGADLLAVPNPYTKNPAAWVATWNTTTNAAALREFANTLQAPQGVKADAQAIASNADLELTVPEGWYLVQDSTADEDKTNLIVGTRITVKDEQGETTATYTKLNDMQLGVVNSKSGIVPGPTKTADTDGDGTADTEAVGIGDVIPFTITDKIPNYTGKESMGYKITDTASKGLAVPAIVSGYTITVGGEPVTVNFKQETNHAGVTVTTFDFGDLVEKQYEIGAKVKITYSATVTTDAMDNVTNKADSDAQSSPKDPDVDLKLGKFSFTKTDKDGNGLDGATFQVKQGETVLKFVQEADGSYRLATESDENATTDLTTADVDGVFNVRGLKAGDYTVVETAAPNGYYQSMLGSFKVTINANGTATFTDTDKVIDLVTVADNGASVKVMNVKSATELPLTGAAGTMLFTVLGLLIAGAGALVYMKSRSVKHMLRG